MIRIRVDHLFTYPQNLKNKIIKSLPIIKPYFNNKIIFPENRALCTLNTSSLESDIQLYKLIEELEHTLVLRYFEASCIVDNSDIDDILTNGIIPSPEIPVHFPVSNNPCEDGYSLVKCAIKLRYLSEEYRDAFILELIKCFSYDILNRYTYRIDFNAVCSSIIPAENIIEIVKY